MIKSLTLSILLSASFCSAQIFTESFGTGANQFSIKFVEIGDQNNLNDSTGYGAVNYQYRIGKYEISQGQIDAASANGLAGMSIPATAYNINQPAAYLSWFQAAAFVNWLNTSSGYQAAYNMSWNGSAYTMNLWNSSEAWKNGGVNLYRHSNARYFLPNENEWYKAAYYNPNNNTYSLYPTQSNIAPLPVSAGSSDFTSVFSPDPSVNQFLVPADIENAGGPSFYGTVGQGGNMVERLESASDGSNDNPGENRSARGGSFFQETFLLESTSRESHTPESQFWSLGFRIASVPEPSALSLFAVGLGVVLRRCRRTV